MKKIIKKQGNSAIIRLSPDDMDVYELEIGDIIEMEIVKLKEDNKRR